MIKLNFKYNKIKGKKISIHNYGDMFQHSILYNYWKIMNIKNILDHTKHTQNFIKIDSPGIGQRNPSFMDHINFIL